MHTTTHSVPMELRSSKRADSKKDVRELVASNKRGTGTGSMRRKMESPVAVTLRKA